MTTNTPEATGDLPSYDEAKSIVDTILDLDSFLSGDVRRYEEPFTFATKPDLQAKVEALVEELTVLEVTLAAPKPQKPSSDEALATPAPEPSTVDDRIKDKIRQIHALESEFADSFRAINLRQIDPEDFVTFRSKWKEEFAKPFLDQDQAMHDELVSITATSPKIPMEKMAAFKVKLGLPTFERLFSTAWRVNTHDGVSIPKSSLSSDDLKLAGLETS